MSDSEDDISVNDPIKNPVNHTSMPRMLRELDSDLDGSVWQSTGAHMVLAMMLAEQVGVRMMKEYFEIEASKATPTYSATIMAETIWAPVDCHTDPSRSMSNSFGISSLHVYSMGFSAG